MRMFQIVVVVFVVVNLLSNRPIEDLGRSDSVVPCTRLTPLRGRRNRYLFQRAEKKTPDVVDDFDGCNTDGDVCHAR